MRKWTLWQKVMSAILIIMFMLLGAGAIYVHQSTYTATEAAQQQSEQAIHKKDYDLYSDGQTTNVGVIFYPGAFVTAESYSKWASQVALAGYNVYVLHMPLNLAVFSKNAAQTIIEDHSEESFVLAGHSLGGVIASRFTAEHPKEVAGMIFLASYPDKKGNLENTDLSALSITASNDGVLNSEKYRKAKVYMPAEAEYREIEGGNHAGFGMYGAQKGDAAATISKKTQQAKISTYIIEWLDELEE
ncbi:MAG: alpha/beta hydrolase, partial [Staphylococcus equorum]|nr:alpha/beta hydrolase [Staphylococcus equorum]